MKERGREREREREWRKREYEWLLQQPYIYVSWRYTLSGNDENHDDVDHDRGARISARARHVRLSNMGISHGSESECIHTHI